MPHAPCILRDGKAPPMRVPVIRPSPIASEPGCHYHYGNYPHLGSRSDPRHRRSAGPCATGHGDHHRNLRGLPSLEIEMQVHLHKTFNPIWMYMRAKDQRHRGIRRPSSSQFARCGLSREPPNRRADCAWLLGQVQDACRGD